MNCDPNALADAARCFSCLSDATLREVETYLLCLLAGGVTPPVDTFFRIIETLEIRSLDTGDLRVYV